MACYITCQYVSLGIHVCHIGNTTCMSHWEYRYVSPGIHIYMSHWEYMYLSLGIHVCFTGNMCVCVYVRMCVCVGVDVCVDVCACVCV